MVLVPQMVYLMNEKVHVKKCAHVQRFNHQKKKEKIKETEEKENETVHISE